MPASTGKSQVMNVQSLVTQSTVQNCVSGGGHMKTDGISQPVGLQVTQEQVLMVI